MRSGCWRFTRSASSSCPGHSRTEETDLIEMTQAWYTRATNPGDSGVVERGLFGYSIDLTDGFYQFKCEAFAFSGNRHGNGDDACSHQWQRESYMVLCHRCLCGTQVATICDPSRKNEFPLVREGSFLTLLGFLNFLSSTCSFPTNAFAASNTPTILSLTWADKRQGIPWSQLFPSWDEDRHLLSIDFSSSLHLQLGVEAQTKLFVVSTSPLSFLTCTSAMTASVCSTLSWNLRQNASAPPLSVTDTNTSWSLTLPPFFWEFSVPLFLLCVNHLVPRAKLTSVLPWHHILLDSGERLVDYVSDFLTPVTIILEQWTYFSLIRLKTLSTTSSFFFSSVFD